MNERVFSLGALRIGRTNLGEAVLTIDDDALVFAVSGDHDELPLRVAHQSIDALRNTMSAIALTLRDGTMISIDNQPHLADEIIGRCQSVPELTRTLRSFGSRRGGRRVGDADIARGSAEQRRFFAPLLEARRNAMHSHGAAAIAAFDARALSASLEATLRGFSADRHAQPGPARRALEAELADLSEPLELALGELRRVSAEATAAANDLRLWRVWSAQLRATFEAADRVWMAVDSALGAVPSRS
ncbi:MAG TPA: hypothetical protein VH277_14505 [Gemmatimonadaceae bacterium]|nr:hypothetical protein [Gemmatimonadaceae bacterium]